MIILGSLESAYSLSVRSIELFALGVMAEALRAGGPKISGGRGRPSPPTLLLRKLG